MKVMTTWSVRPGAIRECVRRYVAGLAAPGPGVTLIGRWHSVDLSVGFSLFEAEDPLALYRSAAPWIEFMELKTTLVIDEKDFAPALLSIFKTPAEARPEHRSARHPTLSDAAPPVPHPRKEDHRQNNRSPLQNRWPRIQPAHA